MKQAESHPFSVDAQIAILLALTKGLLDTIPLALIDSAQASIIEGLGALAPALHEKLASAQPLSDEESDTVLTMIKTQLASVESTPVTKTLSGNEH